MGKVLVKRKFGSIGDMLMMIPSLKEISKKCKLDLMIPKNFKEIFLNLDFINSVIDLKEPINLCNYENIYDLSDYEFNFEQINQPLINKTKIEIFIEAFNLPKSKEKIQIKLSDTEKRWVNLFVKKITSEKIKLS